MELGGELFATGRTDPAFFSFCSIPHNALAVCRNMRDPCNQNMAMIIDNVSLLRAEVSKIIFFQIMI